LIRGLQRLLDALRSEVRSPRPDPKDERREDAMRYHSKRRHLVLFLAGLTVVPVTITLMCGLLKRGGKQPSVTTEAAARRDIAVT
jgi:membrane protein YqaA with SNARE-associated domain